MHRESEVAPGATDEPRLTGRRWINRVPPVAELVVTWGSMLVISWGVLPAAHATGNKIVEFSFLGIVGVMFLWMMILSPWLRRIPPGDRGFSTREEFKVHVTGMIHGRRYFSLFLLLGATTFTFVVFMNNFLSFTIIIPVLGTLNELLVARVIPPVVFAVAVIQFVAMFLYMLVYMMKLDTFKRASVAYLKYGMPFVILLFSWAWFTNHDTMIEMSLGTAIAHFFGYIYWALLQQVSIMVFTTMLLEKAMDEKSLINRKATKHVFISLVTAGLFAVVHFPAWTLALVAFFMEFIITMVYLEPRTRNILSACALHAICGLVIVFFLDINIVSGYLAFFS